MKLSPALGLSGLILWTFVSVVTLAPVELRAQTVAASPSIFKRRPPSLFSTEYVFSVWDDTRSVVSAPLRWDAADWRTAGIWTGATLAAAGFDHDIRRSVQAHTRSQSSDRFFRDWQKLGAEYSLVEIGAFEVWGVVGENQNARDTAMDAVSATVIASGVITPLLKYSIGRYRPIQTTTTFKFRPFSGHQSFPSGHATQAFAVAAVVAGHYTAWWQQSLLYGAAALVDFSRVQQNAHFTSDVVAGSAIGWAVGRAVVRRHALPAGYSLAPWMGNGSGIMLCKNF